MHGTCSKTFFRKIKQLNFVLIQNQAFSDFQVQFSQAKWQRFQNYIELLCTALAATKIFGCSKWKTCFSLLQFYDSPKPAKKCLLTLTKHSKLSSFTNMVTKIVRWWYQNLRTNEAENRQKIKNSLPQLKIYWLLLRKRYIYIYIMLPMLKKIHLKLINYKVGCWWFSVS